MWRARLLFGWLFLLVSLPAAASEKAAAADDRPHAVIVVGTPHYSPQKSMPRLAGELERLGFRTTVILPQGNPEKNGNGVGLPGLEALAEADVALFFMRFLALPDDQFQHIMEYVKAGKPVVGLRTSTHAFLYPKGHKRFHWNNDFGRDVLGTAYIVHQQGKTECRVAAQHSDHPILAGVGEEPFTSAGTLYLTSLQPGCMPLVLGTGSRSESRLVENNFGTYYAAETETDVVAWTWENQWGGRVFCTSFGHVGDFSVAPVMRTMINGICWAAGEPIPSAGTTVTTFTIEEAQRSRRRPRQTTESGTQ